MFRIARIKSSTSQMTRSIRAAQAVAQGTIAATQSFASVIRIPSQQQHSRVSPHDNVGRYNNKIDPILKRDLLKKLENMLIEKKRNIQVKHAITGFIEQILHVNSFKIKPYIDSTQHIIEFTNSDDIRFINDERTSLHQIMLQECGLEVELKNETDKKNTQLYLIGCLEDIFKKLHKLSELKKLVSSQMEELLGTQCELKTLFGPGYQYKFPLINTDTQISTLNIYKKILEEAGLNFNLFVPRYDSISVLESYCCLEEVANKLTAKVNSNKHENVHGTALKICRKLFGLFSSEDIDIRAINILIKMKQDFMKKDFPLQNTYINTAALLIDVLSGKKIADNNTLCNAIFLDSKQDGYPIIHALLKIGAPISKRDIDLVKHSDEDLVKMLEEHPNNTIRSSPRKR